jgi:hypothetical protein
VGWGDRRRDSQREAGEVDTAAAVTAGDDEVQSWRQHTMRLGFELVRCDALARSRIEAGEDHP